MFMRISRVSRVSRVRSDLSFLSSCAALAVLSGLMAGLMGCGASFQASGIDPGRPVLAMPMGTTVISASGAAGSPALNLTAPTDFGGQVKVEHQMAKAWSLGGSLGGAVGGIVDAPIIPSSLFFDPQSMAGGFGSLFVLAHPLESIPQLAVRASVEGGMLYNTTAADAAHIAAADRFGWMYGFTAGTYVAIGAADSPIQGSVGLGVEARQLDILGLNVDPDDVILPAGAFETRALANFAVTGYLTPNLSIHGSLATGLHNGNEVTVRPGVQLNYEF